MDHIRIFMLIDIVALLMCFIPEASFAHPQGNNVRQNRVSNGEVHKLFGSQLTQQCLVTDNFSRLARPQPFSWIMSISSSARGDLAATES
jgi:hypothetical protein